MTLDEIKTLVEAGATGALVVALVYLVKVWIPKLNDQFLAALKENRDDDSRCQERQRQDYLAAQTTLHADFLTAQERTRSDFLAATEKQRTDYLEASRLGNEQHWRQAEAQRASCEEGADRDRKAHQLQVETLAHSISNLADIIIHQGTETRRRDGLGMPPEEKK